MMTPKQVLTHYLEEVRSVALWKLEGVSEYDARRPLTGTGSNILGIIKHLGTMEFSYFGLVFDRLPGESMPWMDNALWNDNADMWATAEQSPAWIKAFYRRSIAHANATIDALALTTIGRVPWWRPDRAEVTLQQILVHMIAETARHVGQLDIIREQADGQIGYLPAAGRSNIPDQPQTWWAEYHAKLQALADQARKRG